MRRVALEALRDMRGDGVRYAELRTTPRPLADGTSRRGYVEAVLRVFRDFEAGGRRPAAATPDARRGSASSTNIAEESTNDLGADGGGGGGEGEPYSAGTLTPRLLLSVDRGKSVEEAMRVAELAVELRAEEEWRPFVLGVDFSGNPTKGSFKDFRSGPGPARPLG